MASIDDRIVNMQFNNSQFQKGVSETNKSLQDLEKNLKLDGATQGIDKVQSATNRFSMANMDSALSNISRRFNALGAIGFSILQSLTQGALAAGKKMAASLLEPLIQGGAKRALALQLAKFQFRGLGLDIEATMEAALGAVKGTAFGLDDAATAAAVFGATGITAGNGLQDVLRSVAGVAAQTGSSYSQVANIFQTIAGNGRLMGDQLNQLASYGVNSAAILGKALGKTEADIRDMVSKGQISFKVFSDVMNEAFGANAAKANETYTGALANMNAAISRIGASVASPYFFGMRDIFNSLGPMFDRINTAIGPVLLRFEKLMGIFASDAVKRIDSLNFDQLLIISHSVAEAMKDIFGIVKDLGILFGKAFAQIFPPKSTREIASIAEALRDFTESLKPTVEQAGELRRAFAGVLAVFSIAGQIVSRVVGVLFDLIGVAAPVGGSFLTIAANIGDFIVGIDTFLKTSSSVKSFFNGISSALEGPVAVFATFFGIIADGVKSFIGLDSGGFTGFADAIEERFSALSEVAGLFMRIWDWLVEYTTKVFSAFSPMLVKIGDGIADIFGKLVDTFKQLSFDQVLQVFNTGSLAVVALAFQGFFGNIRAALRGDGLGFITQFKIIFGLLRTNLKALEINTNAKTLTQIAIAVALLAASAVALSLVDGPKLAFALGAIGSMIAGLLVAFSAFSKMQTGTGIFDALVISMVLQTIAGAVLTLSLAVLVLAALPLPRLLQGVGALVVVMLALVGAVTLLNKVKVGPSLFMAAAAIAIIAPAMLLLAGAIAIFGAIPLDNLVNGIGAFIVVLTAISGAVMLLGVASPRALLGAFAIAAIAGSLVPLIGAIALLGAIPYDNLVNGIGGFVLALVAVTGAVILLSLTGPSALLGAIAISAVALSMIPLIGAIALLGMLPFDNLMKGLAGFAIAMAILVGAVLLLGFTGPVALIGAAAIVAIALAMAVLAPALVLMAGISWDAIGRLLTILSAGLGILAVMGILLIPASVGFLLLGVAILLIGNGVMMAATGIGLLAVGLVALMAVGSGGVALIGMAISAFIEKLPELAVAVGNALVTVAVTIGTQAPILVAAFVNIIVAMLDAVQTIVPKIIETATVLILALIDALVILIPELIAAGITILLALLQGIADNIERVVTLALTIIANFINGLARGLPRLLQAGANLVLSFINGIADTIRNNRKKFTDAALNIVDALTGGLSTGLINGIGTVKRAVNRLISNIPQAIKDILGIRSPSRVAIALMEYFGDGAVVGLKNKTSDISNAANGLGNSAVNSLKESLSGVADILGNDIDMSPTIRPLVDLSDIQNAAKQIPGLLRSPKLSLDTTSNVARSVSLQEQDRNATLVLDASDLNGSARGDTTFIQNNNSPKALNPVEIYRNTKNQLSTLKGELGVVDQSGSS